MNVRWDDGAEALALEPLLRGSRPTDGRCPVCRGTEIHLFFHRHRDRADRGGGWVWCSRCRRFLHATVLVPQWWSNLDSVPESALAGIPELLDHHATEIDAHLARLKSANPSGSVDH